MPLPTARAGGVLVVSRSTMHSSSRIAVAARSAIAFGVLLATAIQAGAQTDLTHDVAAITAEYLGVQAALARGDDGKWRKTEEKPPPELLERAWRLVTDALVRYLDAHPETNAVELFHYVETLNPPEEPPADAECPDCDWEQRERYRLHAH